MIFFSEKNDFKHNFKFLQHFAFYLIMQLRDFHLPWKCTNIIGTIATSQELDGPPVTFAVVHCTAITEGKP